MAVEINRLLDVVIRENASDLHCHVGRPPTIRLHGELRALNLGVLTADDTMAMMKSITSERHQQELAQRGGAARLRRCSSSPCRYGHGFLLAPCIRAARP